MFGFTMVFFITRIMVVGTMGNFITRIVVFTIMVMVFMLLLHINNVGFVRHVAWPLRRRRRRRHRRRWNQVYLYLWTYPWIAAAAVVVVVVVAVVWTSRLVLVPLDVLLVMVPLVQKR